MQAGLRVSHGVHVPCYGVEVLRRNMEPRPTRVVKSRCRLPVRRTSRDLLPETACNVLRA